MCITSVPFTELLRHAVASKQLVWLLSYNLLQIQDTTICLTQKLPQALLVATHVFIATAEAEHMFERY